MPERTVPRLSSCGPLSYGRDGCACGRSPRKIQCALEIIDVHFLVTMMFSFIDHNFFKLLYYTNKHAYILVMENFGNI